MNILKAIALTLILAFQLTNADTITLSCTLPTLNEDGSALTDLDGTRYYEANVTGGPYTLVYDETDPTVCGAVLERTAGTYFYVATAYNASGVESQYSGEATKTISTVPAPPMDLVVDPAELAAFTYSQSGEDLSTYQVGWVADGTACDSTKSINGLYQVPKSSVTFVGDADANIVFAACSGG